jgi:hypothetical protein
MFDRSGRFRRGLRNDLPPRWARVWFWPGGGCCPTAAPFVDNSARSTRAGKRGVIAHGATIDKFIGDAIVIFFGDPETLGIKEDATACVSMAIAMRKRMKELEVLWREAGLEKPLQCRMGINTGVCTVGNFGSDDRMDYTIIGGGVNLAARLETACTPSEILISYETYAHVKDRVYCEEQDPIEVKGISRPVATYRMVNLYENLEDKNQTIRAKLPHFQLDVDVTLMTAQEQRQAAAVLLDAAERLSNAKAKA